MISVNLTTLIKKVISSKICECDSNSACEWVLGKTLLDELREAAVDVQCKRCGISMLIE